MKICKVSHEDLYGLVRICKDLAMNKPIKQQKQDKEYAHSMRALIAAASHGAAHKHTRVVRIKNFPTGLGLVRRIGQVSHGFVRLRKGLQGLARICEVSHKDLLAFARIC